MVTAITEGIKVSVQVNYQSDYSSPHQHHYVFVYRIHIENSSPATVQLLSRRWEIFDAGESKKTVEGEGVVGQQPIIEPGGNHQYVSGCNLRSGLGKMKGSYLMERVQDGKLLDIAIPEFNLIADIFDN